VCASGVGRGKVWGRARTRGCIGSVAGKSSSGWSGKGSSGAVKQLKRGHRPVDLDALRFSTHTPVMMDWRGNVREGGTINPFPHCVWGLQEVWNPVCLCSAVQ
jgi:hypothetical protein